MTDRITITIPFTTGGTLQLTSHEGDIVGCRVVGQAKGGNIDGRATVDALLWLLGQQNAGEPPPYDDGLDEIPY